MGRHIIALIYLSVSVTGFELNAATGELTPKPGSPFDVGPSADLFATF
jgi:hypothetical protein